MPLEELLDYFSQQADSTSPAMPGLQLTDSGATGSYRGLRLTTAFQPLLDAHSLEARSHEALLRVHDASGKVIPPATAFSLPETSEEAVYFDRLCRIVHAVNFVRQASPGAELFLNVSGRHLLGVGNGEHGETFERLLQNCGLRPQQIILEILEARVDNLARLNDAVAAYRERGYRVAIDDFGCEHSNFDRLWRLTPDLVKLDRSLILEGTTNLRARRILPRLIEIIHELGAQVVCEGIETPEQHWLAVDSGTDLVQGFLYARPAPHLAPDTQLNLAALERLPSLPPKASRLASTAIA